MNWRLFFSQFDSLSKTPARWPQLPPVGIFLPLIFGSILVLAAMGTGQFWLFLLGAVQLLLIPFTQMPTTSHGTGDQLTASRLQAALIAAMPVCRTVAGRAKHGMWRLWQAVLRCLWSTAAGLVVGLLLLGWFALEQPELWRWGTLQTEGPPLGATALMSGAVLMTTLGMFWLLSWCAKTDH